MKDPVSIGTSRKAVPHATPDPHFKAEGLKVAVITSRDDSGSFLIRELQRMRVTTHHVMPSAEPLPADADVIYCDYAPDLSRRIPWLTGEGRTALVVIVPQTETIVADALLSMTPSAVLARPFTTNAIIASLVMAWTQFRYEQRLHSKVERLEDNLRSMRMVERAKALLMSSRGLSDEEAYRHIRSQAMARRMSISSLAAAILSSFDILGGDTH